MTFFSASMRSVCLVCAVLLSACQPEQDKKDPATPATGIVAKVEQGLQQGLGQADKGLQEARKNIDAARQKLATEDLSLNRRGAEHLPKARITPQGELLIGDQPVAITPEQKALVLAYREQLLGIIGDSMAIGMEGASVGINAAATALKAVASGGSADDVGKQAEAAAMQQIKPWVDRLCGRMPGLLAAQQSLAEAVPEFKPYATADASDVDDCKNGNNFDF
jgi:hypothetical protein